MKKFGSYIALSIIIFLAWKLLEQYFLSPSYLFRESIPFHGKFIINPYQKVEFNKVSIANFHAHVSCWNGLTNGKGTPKDLYVRYDSLGYDFHAISQYHKIDTFGQHFSNYIPVYEHGYNLMKTHQLVIGSKKVIWKDYFFPQTIHNKQEILEKLSREKNNIVVINHPMIRDGYTFDDIKRLQYYDYIELLNPSSQSIQHWDTILTNGKKVFAMGNDDVHDVFKVDGIGRFATILFGLQNKRNDPINILRSGSSAAVWLPHHLNETLQLKKNRIDGIRNLINSIQLKDTTLLLQLQLKAKEIRLITNHGKVKSSWREVNFLQAALNNQESYWRFEIYLNDGTIVFLNPLYRQPMLHALTRNEIGKQFISRNFFIMNLAKLF